MPRPGGFQPMKKGQRKLAPGPQTQAMNRGSAVGSQGKMLAQSLRNQTQAKSGPVAKVALPGAAPKSGGPGKLKELLAQRDTKMLKKSKVGRMPRKRKSLIPPQSSL